MKEAQEAQGVSRVGPSNQAALSDDSVHSAPKSAGQIAFVEVVCAIQCSGKVQD